MVFIGYYGCRGREILIIIGMDIERIYTSKHLSKLYIIIIIGNRSCFWKYNWQIEIVRNVYIKSLNELFQWVVKETVKLNFRVIFVRIQFLIYISKTLRVCRLLLWAKRIFDWTYEFSNWASWFSYWANRFSLYCKIELYGKDTFGSH